MASRQRIRTLRHHLCGTQRSSAKLPPPSVSRLIGCRLNHLIPLLVKLLRLLPQRQHIPIIDENPLNLIFNSLPRLTGRRLIAIAISTLSGIDFPSKPANRTLKPSQSKRNFRRYAILDGVMHSIELFITDRITFIYHNFAAVDIRAPLLPAPEPRNESSSPAQ